jgi:uncharacterized repeat protein (TIGR03837 family)
MSLFEPQASFDIAPQSEHCRCSPEGPGVLVGVTLAHAAPQSDTSEVTQQDRNEQTNFGTIPHMTKSQRWDIFCKVIDNFGDIGVCWRLACNLAQRGQQVRLWVDDASALQWMAPQGCDGVEIKSWTQLTDYRTGDVLIEAFGCEIAPEIVATCATEYWARVEKGLKNIVWINLEYLSAEPFVERSHGLPSPVMSGPAKGMSKWFFYPGFTERTGGLLREADLLLATLPLANTTDARRISLFCYEPAALPQLLQQLVQGTRSTELLVTHGRAATTTHNALKTLPETHFSIENDLQPNKIMHEQLLISEHLKIEFLPALSQPDYDLLLRSCHLNLVRGEDSLVRALWAGQAFVWHIYPQSDGAHAAKLDAFLDWLDAPADLRLFHHVWNGLSNAPLPAINLQLWAACTQAAAQHLRKQLDLVTQLQAFVEQKSQ